MFMGVVTFIYTPLFDISGVLKTTGSIFGETWEGMGKRRRGY